MRAFFVCIAVVLAATGAWIVWVAVNKSAIWHVGFFWWLVVPMIVVLLGAVARVAIAVRHTPTLLAIEILLWFSASLAAGILAVWLLTYIPAEFIIGTTLALAVAVAVVTFRRADGRRRRWIGSGHCGQCGYDLRGSTDQCPECGTPVAEELLRRRRIASALRATRCAPHDLTSPPSLR